MGIYCFHCSVNIRLLLMNFISKFVKKAYNSTQYDFTYEEQDILLFSDSEMMRTFWTMQSSGPWLVMKLKPMWWKTLAEKLPTVKLQQNRQWKETGPNLLENPSTRHWYMNWIYILKLLSILFSVTFLVLFQNVSGVHAYTLYWHTSRPACSKVMFLPLTLMTWVWCLVSICDTICGQQVWQMVFFWVQ